MPIGVSNMYNNLYKIIFSGLFITSASVCLPPNTITGIVDDPDSLISLMYTITLSPSGNTLYCANVSTNSIAVINTTSNEATTVIDQTLAPFNLPFQLAITPDGTTGYVTDFGSNTISIIDISQNKATGYVNDPDSLLYNPFWIAITPDGTTGYITNRDPSFSLPRSKGVGNTVAVLDIASNTITQVINNSSFNLSWAIAITPDGSTAYVTNSGGNTVSIIDTSTNQVTGTINDTLSPFNGPVGIVISPDGTTGYVANAAVSPGTISIFSTATNTVTASISDPTFQGCYTLALSPDGKTLYVTNVDVSTISIIDTTTNTVTGLVSDPDATLNIPFSMVITPNGSAGYIGNFAASTISIMYIQPSPPSSAQGCQTRNIFLSQTEFLNVLRWSAPQPQLSPIVSYKIYGNQALTDLIATVPANGPLEYSVHNVLAYHPYTYYLVSVDANGMTSLPVSIPVTFDCIKTKEAT